MKFKPGYYYNVPLDDLMIVYPDGTHDVDLNGTGENFYFCNTKADDCYSHYEDDAFEYMGKL